MASIVENTDVKNVEVITKNLKNVSRKQKNVHKR